MGPECQCTVFAGMTPSSTSFITPPLRIIPTFGWKRGFGGHQTEAKIHYIYHPDFSDGHPTYFDVSVRNTLQPGNHNRASTDAGAAAIAGEMEKDSKHAGAVEEAGGRFFPLVTETLGVWTPSSLLLLRTFAERTTLRNGLSSPSIVARNLMQQVSVKLWSYNAKMIL